MEEKIDRIEKAVEQTQKNVGQIRKDIKDLVEIVGSITANMVTKGEFEDFEEQTENNFAAFKKETGENFEVVKGKIVGLRGAVDAGFERQSALESRVSKIEVHLHLEQV